MSTGKAPWLLCCWLLWQAAAPVLPNAPIEGAAVTRSYETEAECLTAATVKRATRNVIILRGAPAYEVFTCLPREEGTDPAWAECEK